MEVALQVLGALLLLVLASDAFTNAVEWIGALAGLTRSAVGAVLAALGSSLPETVVAFIALVLLADPRSVDVGIGAVIGAPLMLSTVLFALIGVSALALGRQHTTVEAHASTTVFGLGLFCVTFAVVIGASFAPTPFVRGCAAIAVLVGYVAYLVYHIRFEEQESDEAPPPLRIAPRAARPRWGLVVAQLVVATALTAVAARWFVLSVSNLAAHVNISPLLASLVLTPIATEMPEAINVIVWTRRDEDELALGNVIGAMMFQTSVASAIALLATSWHLGTASYRAAAATFGAALLVLVWTIVRRRVEALPLMLCVLFYVAFLVAAFVRL